MLIPPTASRPSGRSWAPSHAGVAGGVVRSDWPDLKITTAPPLLRVKPGSYEARSVDLQSFTAFRRRILVVSFELYDGPAVNGIVLGQVPCYFSLPPRRLSSASKLGRVFQLLGVRPRADRLPLRLLQHRLWRVVVADVEKDIDGNALPEANVYSVIRSIREHLA